MPIYEYRCSDCEEKVELLVRSSSSDPGACPKCSGKLARQLSTFSVGASSPSSSNGGGMCQQVCAPAGT